MFQDGAGNRNGGILRSIGVGFVPCGAFFPFNDQHFVFAVVQPNVCAVFVGVCEPTIVKWPLLWRWGH